MSNHVADRGARLKRLVLLSLGVLLLFTCVVFVRNAVESHRSARLGDDAMASEDINGAILHYRHALELYVPFGGAGEAACEKLAEIGDERAATGDIETALFAYRSARAGIFATRHFWIPLEEEIPGFNERIALLMSRQAAGGKSGDPSAASRYAKQLGAYKERQVSPGFGFLAGFSFLLWLGSLGLVVIRGFDSRGKPRASLRWLVPSALLLLVAWLVMLCLA